MPASARATGPSGRPRRAAFIALLLAFAPAAGHAEASPSGPRPQAPARRLRHCQIAPEGASGFNPMPTARGSRLHGGHREPVGNRCRLSGAGRRRHRRRRGRCRADDADPGRAPVIRNRRWRASSFRSTQRPAASSPGTGAKPPRWPPTSACSSMRPVSPCRSSRRWSADARSACRAWCACSRRHIASPGARPGPICCSRRSTRPSPASR